MTVALYVLGMSINILSQFLLSWTYSWTKNYIYCWPNWWGNLSYAKNPSNFIHAALRLLDSSGVAGGGGYSVIAVGLFVPTWFSILILFWFVELKPAVLR